MPSSPSSSLLLRWIFFVALIIRCRQIFVCLIFVGRGTNENLSPTIIPPFTVSRTNNVVKVKGHDYIWIIVLLNLLKRHMHTKSNTRLIQHTDTLERPRKWKESKSVIFMKNFQPLHVSKKISCHVLVTTGKSAVFWNVHINLFEDKEKETQTAGKPTQLK